MAILTRYLLHYYYINATSTDFYDLKSDIPTYFRYFYFIYLFCYTLSNSQIRLLTL